MNTIDIYKTIHDYVVLVTGLPGKDVRQFRPDYGVNTSKNRGTIVSIGLINPTPIGLDSVFYKNIDGESQNVTEVISSDVNITASIKVYGSDSADVINKIANGLRRSAAQEIFYNAELGFIRKGQVVSISDMMNGSYEEIRQLDVEFHVTHVNSSNINAIESATVETEAHMAGITNTNIEVEQ